MGGDKWCHHFRFRVSWAPKQLIRLRSWRLPKHVGRKALYSISGWLPASGAIISVSGTRGLKALYSISGWLPASGAIISVSGTRGLKCPLFYFRSFGAKTDLASSCTLAIGSRAWPTSKKGIHAQTKECAWNGTLIRSQHATAKPTVPHLRMAS